MHIAFFGSSLVSAYWNGAATYYRGILKALHARGHRITFYEPDAYNRQQHRDIPDPPYATVVVYPADALGVARALDAAAGADLIVKASGVGVFDDLLAERIAAMGGGGTRVALWDVDAPATLDTMDANPADPLIDLVPRYDAVFTYGGGQPVIDGYTRFGARRCVPIYNAHDPDVHHPEPPQAQYKADLSFLGNRLPDREQRVEEFFLRPACVLDDRLFRIGGSGWEGKLMSPNVKRMGHVYTSDHNVFNCSPLAVLNIARESMARYGWSPATRVFEAAAAGACMITDDWKGVEDFFEPGREILVAADGDEVIETLRGLDEATARRIGAAARRRALTDHTYADRAARFESAFAQIKTGSLS